MNIFKRVSMLALALALALSLGEIHIVALDVLLEGDIDGNPELVAGALLRLDAEGRRPRAP